MTQQQYRRRRGAAVMARRQPDHRWGLLLALLFGLTLLLLTATAFAQEGPPKGYNLIPAPVPLQSPGASASGVIQSPAQVDPGIKAKPPVPSSSMATPVIPPPGSAGGNQQVQPK